MCKKRPQFASKAKEESNFLSVKTKQEFYFLSSAIIEPILFYPKHEPTFVKRAEYEVKFISSVNHDSKKF